MQQRRDRLRVPAELEKQVGGYSYRHVWDSDYSDNYRFTRSESEPVYYLKRLKRASRYDVNREKQVLSWLQGRLPVAQVVGSVLDEKYHYLLMTALEGTPAHKLVRQYSAEAMITKMVEAMLMLHNIPVQSCPFDETLQAKLRNIRLSLDNGYLRKDIYNSKTKRKAEADLRYLIENIPAEEDLVFTHGDFCLPNFLLSGHKITGIVDLGDAGKADRYMDICTLAITMCYNYKGFDKFFYYARLIFEQYGITHPDWEKLHYYHLVNEML